MFNWLANWWDGVDLWLTQLPFAFQFAIVVVVLAPICLVVSWAIDRAVDALAPRLWRHSPARLAAAEPGDEPGPEDTALRPGAEPASVGGRTAAGDGS